MTITGTFWAGLEPAGSSPAVIDQRLALPVEGEVPSSFSVPGLRIETGVLARREEAYVELTMADDWPDLLEGAPGGPLPPDQLITLTELLEERGSSVPRSGNGPRSWTPKVIRRIPTRTRSTAWRPQ